MSVSCCPPLIGQHSSRWPGRPQHLLLEGLEQQQPQHTHPPHHQHVRTPVTQSPPSSMPQGLQCGMQSILPHSTKGIHPLHPMACIMWHSSISSTTIWLTMYTMHHTPCIPCMPLPLTPLGVEEARACTLSGPHREARGGNPPCQSMVLHSQ